MFSKTGLAKLIDAALLRGNATGEDVKRLCATAKKYHFASVTVFPYWVNLAARELQGSDVKVSTVVGHPFGALSPLIKAAQVRQAVHDGASGVEIILNIGELVAEHYELIRKEIHEAVNAAKMRALTEDGGDVAVLVNVETAYTTREQQRRVCHILAETRGDFVVTNTGYASRGVTVEDILALRDMADRDLGIKAAGGVRTVEQARTLISAGADRLGTSAGIQIVETFENGRSSLD
ncbi:MAG TPA: deoxyribose-phosphate aldolase [Armatimonadota bacterium]|jgi:deoxyribose-phosphate aldolase